jgi:hypothetical protein
MTWIKFTFWLLGIYTAYYAALITWDFLRSRGGAPADNARQELTFVENIEPIRLPAEDSNVPGKESPVSFSGGVTLKQLFNLAREESVEYVKSVSF